MLAASSSQPAPCANECSVKAVEKLLEVRQQRNSLLEQIRRVEDRLRSDSVLRAEATNRAVLVAASEAMLIQGVFCGIGYLMTFDETFREVLPALIKAAPSQYSDVLNEVSRLLKLVTQEQPPRPPMAIGEDAQLTQLFTDLIDIIETDDHMLRTIRSRRCLELKLLEGQVASRALKLRDRGVAKSLIETSKTCTVVLPPNSRDQNLIEQFNDYEMPSQPAQNIMDVLRRLAAVCRQRLRMWEELHSHETTLSRTYAWLIRGGNTLINRIKNQIQQCQQEIKQLQTYLEQQQRGNANNELANVVPLLRPSALSVFDIRLEQKEYDETLLEAQLAQTRLSKFVKESVHDYDQFAVGKLGETIIELFKEACR